MRLETAPLTVETALQVGYSAAVRLGELVQPDGRFVYLYEPPFEPLGGTRYSIVRHAGCVWAMNQAACLLLFGQEFHNTRKRALNWLFRTNLAASPQKGLSITESGKIKLGANALAIVALLSYEDSCDSVRGSLNNELSALVAGLCDHILAQVTSDGDFIHTRDAKTGAIDGHRCEYFTGEALFALLTALEWCPHLEHLRMAQELLHGLAEREYGVVEQNHWMMYTAEISDILAPDSATMSYADRLAREILTRSNYRDGQRCTQIACRTEALLAYLRILQHRGRANCSLFAETLTEIQTNLILQMRDRAPDGAFCRGAGIPTVRMDYIQHNLVAFLGYARLNDTP